jgi:Fe-S cluster assembly ATP-binding protein
MLKIDNLHAAVTDSEEEILKGVDLKIASGEVHAIMGPNGSGKSTLANVIMGKPSYTITEGDITVDDESIVDLTPDERAHLGIFLAMQYPSEVPGVRPWQFLKAAKDAIDDARGQKKMSVREFSRLFDQKVEESGVNPELIKRSLNEGFSGGEKKRNEMLQLQVLNPRIAIMDETDSGLDIDALQAVADGVNKMRSPGRSFLIVTHYQRLLRYVRPEVVHVLVDGKIVETGDELLAEQVEKNGYRDYLQAR